MKYEKIIKTIKEKVHENKKLSMGTGNYSFYEGKRRGLLEALELISMLNSEHNK